MTGKDNTIQTVLHIIILLGLIVVLLGVLTWTGIIRCSVIPGFCEVYYSVLGEPKVLILYGDDGLGDPIVLQKVLSNPKSLNLRVDLKHLNLVSEQNLKEYQLIIVEHARTMSTKKMRDIFAYINAGGKIIWIGDSGVELTTQDKKDDLYLYRHEIYTDENADNPVKVAGGPGGWARKTKDGKITNLENFISVRYVGNYCEIVDKNPNCTNLQKRAGLLIPSNTDHAFVYGLRKDLQYYGDFAVVKEVPGIGTRIIMSIDSGQPIKDEEPYNIAPVLVSSGAITEKIVYYAMPLENFVKQPNNYPNLIENLYRGLIN